MVDKLRTESMDSLLKGIVAIDNLDDAYKFFEDLCTVKELEAMAQRFEVAKLLREGITYTLIEEKTGASSATISRVNRCLNYGTDGYDLVIEKAKEA